MKNILPLFFIVIFCSTTLFSMETFPSEVKKFLPLFITEKALELNPEKSWCSDLEKLPKAPLNEKCNFIEECMNIAVKLNNKDPQALLPLLNLFPRAEDLNRDALRILSRDASVFNRILFKYGNHLELPIYSIIHSVKCACTIMVDNHKNREIDMKEYSFRINGRTFLYDRWDKANNTDEGKKEYWKTVLNPTLFPEKFQTGGEKEKKWGVRELQNKIELFLLCTYALREKTGIKIPKIVMNKCIIEPLFNQSLEAIENDFKIIGRCIEKEFNTYFHHHNKVTRGIKLTRDPIQEEFFTQFHQWYAQKCNKVFKNKFAVMAQLFAYKK